MKRPLLAILLALSLGCAGAAHAQNILILTTGDGNTVVPPAPSSNSGDIENNYMDGVIREFGAPLTLATCSSTPQTVTDPNTGLSKTVTCNSSELVNRTAMSPSMFDPGYDLLVVVSAYSEIDALDWPVIEQAIQTRKVRSAILFIDTVTASNADRVKPLLDRALGLTGANVLGNGGGIAHLQRGSRCRARPQALARAHLQQIAAQAGNLVLHRLRGAIAQGDHGDDGTDPNHNAQNRQKRAQQVAPNGAQGQPNRVPQHG